MHFQGTNIRVGSHSANTLSRSWAGRWCLENQFYIISYV